MLFGSKEIFLTKGKVAIVDAKDFDCLNKFKWHANKHGNTFYAARAFKLDNQWVNIKMHRFILNIHKDICIDHVNRDGLDNRRGNLRICSQSQNKMNSGKYCNNKSGYKGVSFFTPRGKWRAQIQAFGKKQHLGYFKTKEEAALAYNKAALQIHKDFAKVNSI